jgi:hypothetical protein
MILCSKICFKERFKHQRGRKQNKESVVVHKQQVCLEYRYVVNEELEQKTLSVDPWRRPYWIWTLRVDPQSPLGIQANGSRRSSCGSNRVYRGNLVTISLSEIHMKILPDTFPSWLRTDIERY